MRYIQLDTLLAEIFADDGGTKAKARLERAHRKLERMASANRKAHTDRNGPNKWKPIKDRLTNVLGRKCWYTEVELVGAPLAVDHYRPIRDYWWLSFDAQNYRVACPWANSPEQNSEYGIAGGKGENFPLLPPAVRATRKSELPSELPLILDPCNPRDCELLAFQADGRPILNPAFTADAVAMQRVEQSKILLNIDHPDFNSKREQLCREIADDVRVHEALASDSAERATIRTRLIRRLQPAAPFSTAAKFYFKLHRHLDWVEDIVNAL